MTRYIQSEFGDKEGLFRVILGDLARKLGPERCIDNVVCYAGDFFRHGFDGSGADNFYDAVSNLAPVPPLYH
jgi:hypothetical protein